MILGAFLASCGSDDSVSLSGETGAQVSFDLGSLTSDVNIGTATFAELEDGSTKVTVMITGATGGHPMHIHENTAAEGGDILITLNDVDASGMSETIVSSTDDGTAISYEQMTSIDGYINIHQSLEVLTTLIAQGDVGINALTGTSVSVDLGEVDAPGVSGTATFHERVSGETLVILSLDNTSDGDSHPSHIHFNSAAEGGDIAVTLTSVDGASGMSKTNVSALDDDTSITYEQLVAFDGYINVHQSADDLGTLVSQGDIGVNVLTGTSVSYDLNEVDVPGVSGTAVFHERVSGETLLVITLTGTTAGDSHPSHIHAGAAADGPGAIVVTLADVDGTTGISMTHIAEKDDSSAVTYSQLTQFDGYINVHNSSEDLATLVAQGDIGSNVTM